jgi:hypothetical protein
MTASLNLRKIPELKNWSGESACAATEGIRLPGWSFLSTKATCNPEAEALMAAEIPAGDAVQITKSKLFSFILCFATQLLTFSSKQHSNPERK